MPDDPDLPRTSQGLEAGGTAALVLADVASRVRALLDTGAIGTGRKAERLKPSDIGILVPSQRRATETANVLREWGIPTVRARTGSVLESEAALQWRLLLAGLATPTYAPVARAAGLSWFFDIAPHELVAASRATQPDGDSPLARLQRGLAALGERMRRDGVGALYEELRATPELLDAVLGRPNGDRDLTDLDHLAELLVAELAGRPSEPAAVAEAFDRMIATADDQSEASMRRVETDSDAVHITTVHSAKGLEYPVVLVPFAYTERASANRPYVFNDEIGRVVDVASWVAWGDGADEGSKEGTAAAKERKRMATVEVDGDTLRLLYVALTRAKHHLEIWWAPTRRAGTSALGRLLLDRWGAATVFNSPLGDVYEKADAAAASKQIDALVAASNGTIARFDVPLEHPVRTPLSLPAAPASLLAVASSRGRHPLADPARRTWSFTALTAGLAASPADHAAAAPVAGGYDEVPDVTGQADEVVGEPVVSVAAAPLIAAPGGTTFGIAVHEVLERVDFTSPTLTGDIEDLVAAVSRRSGLELDVPTTAMGLRGGRRHPARRSVRRAPTGRVLGRRSPRRADVRPHVRIGADRRRRHRQGPVDDSRRHRSIVGLRTPLGVGAGRHRARRMADRLDRRRVPSRRSRVAIRRRRLQVKPPPRARCDRPARRLPTRPARRGDDAQPLPTAGRALLRRPAPLPPLAARGEVFPGAAPRWRRLPVRARDDRPGHTDADRRDLRRVLVAPADGDHPRPRCVVAEDTVTVTITTPTGASVLQPWIDAGVFGATEVHAAALVGDIAGAEATDRAGDVVLAFALAMWAPQHGHSCIDLDTVADIVAAEQAIAAADAGLDEGATVPLPWPVPDAWVAALRASRAVREVSAIDPVAVLDEHPFVLFGRRVYTQRQWVDECAVATAVRRRASRTVTPMLATSVLDRLLPPQVEGTANRQHAAATVASAALLTVVAGGPGTGKTHTVANLLAAELAGSPGLRVRLAAPTGKAASRLSEAVAATAELALEAGDLDTEVAARLGGLEATTVHRLLGWRPDSGTRFRHDAANPLDVDLLVVDETSMLALPLTARLLAALPDECRLVLVGDPDQLRSIEVGTVLADLVDRRPARRAARRPRRPPATPAPHRDGLTDRATRRGDPSR